MANELKLGIPKGSLEKATIELFAKAGWKIKTSSRSYFPTSDDDELKCSLVRPQEMAKVLERGKLDVGIAGRDWVKENDSDVVEVGEMVYSKVSRRPARWVLVVGPDSTVQKPEDLAGATISTELVGFTKRFFAERNIPVDVEFSWGATEAKILKEAYNIDRLRVVDDVDGIERQWIEAWNEAALNEDAIIPFEALYEVQRKDVPMLDIRDSL